jgi:ferredoxin
MDLFESDEVDVVYAEHFNMPNNICNTPLLKPASAKRISKYKSQVEEKLDLICADIEEGIVKKRGFSGISKGLGRIQGDAWQGKDHSKPSLEMKAGRDIRVASDCTSCGLCIKVCPMRNLEMKDGSVQHRNDCTICYRCVNLCPKQAITIWFHKPPKWQYKGPNSE